MTRQELEELRDCIRLLMLDEEDGGDFTGAVGRLCRLAGMRLPQHEETQGLRAMDLSEVHRTPANRPFRAPPPPTSQED